MTPSKQLIAIAEACGWVEHEINSDSWCKNSGHKFSAPTGTSPFLGRHSLPDYLNDLNAMHDAEVTLNHTDRYQYGLTLCRILSIETDGGLDCADIYYTVHATAAKRAEAFLKTIGQWDDKA
jgi:hypothetical protein